MSDRTDAVLTRILSTLVFPIHERFKGHHTVAMRRELESTQWWSPAKIEELRIERLRAFLTRISSSVPYYRRLFRSHGFDPASLDSTPALQALPFLTKSLIRENESELKAGAAVGLKRFNTGGSTGEPLIFWLDRERISHDVAAKWRATRWWNVDIGDREIVLWGSPIELGGQDRVKALRDRMFRSRLLPAFNMSEPDMQRYLDFILQYRPRMLFGYASALALLAQHAQHTGRKLNDVGIRVAFTTGETLYPEQRAAIEDTFDCPVANGYGSRDAGFIAHQCPHGSLHISAEHIIVEVINEAGCSVPPGEAGEVVVTHLATAGFPFVRYRTGDMATMRTDPCACGRGLPAFETVHGRNTDFIRTANGNRMHALALIYEVRDRPGVRAFKIVQEADLSLELMIVAGDELSEGVEEQIRSGIIARMGAGTRVTLRRVAEITPERSGKYRYVVSRATGIAAKNPPA